MIRVTFILLYFLISSISSYSQTIFTAGKQPQVTIDGKGIIRLVFGDGDNIFYATSANGGVSFEKPRMIAEVPGMHLGMTRGPQLATSKDFSLVTAMDKEGNVHSFTLDHKRGDWKQAGKVNDKDSSAPEGLMSVTADENNKFYAVWLDLRNDRKNNICFASFEKSGWSANRFAYQSEEDHVCECCKPSIAVKGKHVSIMFRNWLNGSRDLYLTRSADGGKTFSEAQKLGNGTWVLKGCPMDGGGLSIGAQNEIHTAWQRDGIVFYCQPGKPEQRISDGRHVGLNGNIISWQNGSTLMLQRLHEQAQTIGEGTALTAIELQDKSILAVWEKEGQIVFKRIKG